MAPADGRGSGLCASLRPGRSREVHSAGTGRPRRRQAASRVLRKRQAMVIGPTPPGTGVIAPATSRRLREGDVADELRLALAGGHRLMPTSITTAPGLTQSPRTISGRPTAATRMSARRQTAGQIARPRMGDRDGAVLVRAAAAPSACRRCRAADHDRLEPGEIRPHRFDQHQAAERRAGHKPGSAGREPPGIQRDGSRRRPCRVDRRDAPAGRRSAAAAAAARGCRRPRGRR